MQPLTIQFSKYPFKIKGHPDGMKILDIVRNKFVALQPEEWVRQHFIHFFIHEMKYPRSLMAVEKQILFNGQKRRPDLMVYTREGKPWLILECKSPDHSIDQSVMEQVARYNWVMKAGFLMVSNGPVTYCCQMDYDKKDFNFLTALPAYP